MAKLHKSPIWGPLLSLINLGQGSPLRASSSNAVHAYVYNPGKEREAAGKDLAIEDHKFHLNTL